MEATERSCHLVSHSLNNFELVLLSKKLNKNFCSKKIILNTLNKNRLDASKVLLTSVVSIIHGPSGTGKSTVIVELVTNMIAQYPDLKILVCTQSNCAEKIIPALKLQNF